MDLDSLVECSPARAVTSHSDGFSDGISVPDSIVTSDAIQGVVQKTNPPQLGARGRYAPDATMLANWMAPPGCAPGSSLRSQTRQQHEMQRHLRQRQQQQQQQPPSSLYKDQLHTQLQYQQHQRQPSQKPRAYDGMDGHPPGVGGPPAGHGDQSTAQESDPLQSTSAGAIRKEVAGSQWLPRCPAGEERATSTPLARQLHGNSRSDGESDECIVDEDRTNESLSNWIVQRQLAPASAAYARSPAEVPGILFSGATPATAALSRWRPVSRATPFRLSVFADERGFSRYTHPRRRRLRPRPQRQQ
jgi:hypothetical protein